MCGVKNDPYPIEWNSFNNFQSSSTHAEMNIIVSHIRKNKYNIVRRKFHSSRYKYCKFPKTLVVVSIYKGKFRNSRLCDECIKIMRMYKIKNVIYSTGIKETPFYSENVLTMSFIGHSHGNNKCNC